MAKKTNNNTTQHNRMTNMKYTKHNIGTNHTEYQKLKQKRRVVSGVPEC